MTEDNGAPTVQPRTLCAKARWVRWHIQRRSMKRKEACARFGISEAAYRELVPVIQAGRPELEQAVDEGHIGPKTARTLLHDGTIDEQLQQRVTFAKNRAAKKATRRSRYKGLVDTLDVLNVKTRGFLLENKSGVGWIRRLSVEQRIKLMESLARTAESCSKFLSLLSETLTTQPEGDECDGDED